MPVLNLIKPGVLVLLGALLLAQSVYLATVKVTHLGVMLPAGIGLALVLLGWKHAAWDEWLQAAPWRLPVWRLLLAGFGVWLLSLLAFFVVLHRQGAAVVDGAAPDAIVVLGSSTPGQQPSPALRERLDLAAVLAARYPSAAVIASGGVDFTETVSEAAVMGRYLQAAGVPAASLLLEDKSTSTQENLVFSRRVLDAARVVPAPSLLLVTSDFHTLRAGWIAARAGWTDVRLAGAATPLYMRYNAWLREYFACVSGWLRGEF